ncbi:unnamed protein product, partial [Mesorhabditis belari]|uniref:Domain of unknown function DB domain-containing protein n=1 Tax=Mesorhabditis belari TaxID=2138241 RepID=A0AAF3FH82_9BILA
MFSRSSVLFLLLRSVISIDPFTANLDCLRINVAFCCTSRIRSACPGLCSNIDCSPSFYRGMFSTDEDIQEGTVSVDSSIQRKEAPTIVVTSTSNPFPTLVPETKIAPVTETTVIPITEIMETTKTAKTTAITEMEKETAEIATTIGIWHLGEFGTEASTITIPIETTSLVTDLPITMESRATRVPRIRVTPDPRIIPPPDELAFISDIDENELNEDGSEIQPATSDFLHHHRSQLPEIWMTQFSSSTEFPSVPAASPANDRIFASTISNEQVCGVGPEYSPCIPLDVASARLLSCLQSKNLPIGCQKLARYDVTQKEVRGALDRGACGLLHIAPFLECASQKGDNVECCKTKGVHTKGGQQCLSFCSSGPISPGIQHLSCSSAMQEMLQCHHAGLKP